MHKSTTQETIPAPVKVPGVKLFTKDSTKFKPKKYSSPFKDMLTISEVTPYLKRFFVENKKPFQRKLSIHSTFKIELDQEYFEVSPEIEQSEEGEEAEEGEDIDQDVPPTKAPYETEVRTYNINFKITYGKLDMEKAEINVCLKNIFYVDGFGSHETVWNGVVRLNKYDHWKISGLYLTPDLEESSTMLLQRLEETEFASVEHTIRVWSYNQALKKKTVSKEKIVEGKSILTQMRKEILAPFYAASREAEKAAQNSTGE